MLIIVDLSLTRVIQHSPFPVLCLAYTQVISQIDGAVRAYEHARNDHPTNIHTSIYIIIHIKPLPVPRVFGARSGSPRIS